MTTVILCPANLAPAVLLYPELRQQPFGRRLRSRWGDATSPEQLMLEIYLEPADADQFLAWAGRVMGLDLLAGTAS